MKTHTTVHRPIRSRVLGLAVGLAVVVAPLAAATPSHAASTRVPERSTAVVEVGPSLNSHVIALAHPSVTGTVLNTFVRECSYFTRRCTGYRQVNPPYNRYVGRYYYTKWVWRWI